MSQHLNRAIGVLKPRLYTILAAAFMLAATFVFYASPGVLRSLRFIVFDTYQRFAPAPQLEDSPVRIVAIDNESLARLGQWPWPRTTIARLTDALAERGAKVIVFDILFAEPDRTSPEQMLRWLPPPRARALRGLISRWPTHDGQFARAVARHPTVLSIALQSETTGQSIPDKAGFVFAGDYPADFLPQFPGFVDNVPGLTEAAHGAGFVNWVPDRDQVIRRLPLLASQDGLVAPSLALEALRVAEGQSTYIVRSSNAHGANAFGQHTGVNQVRVGERIFSTDADSSVWMHFRPSNRGRYISAARVLSNEVAPEDIAGKIIIVGATASGLLDLRATPIDAAIPGAEIHQQAIEQMLANRFLTRPDFAPALEYLAALAAILLLAWASPHLSAGRSAALSAAVVLVVFAASLAAFLWARYLFDPVFPAACAFLFGAGSAVYLYSRTEQQRAQIRRAFGQYVAPSVVRQLVAHPEQLKLGGEVRDLTILFCDVRNFTGISEDMSAEQLTSFINSLLTPLSDIIIESGGTIDKYMGDAIMAFWNAPMDDAEHPRRACEAARLMAASMPELNRRWRAEAEAEGRPFTDVAIGIGLNSGDCCVGNLGSHRRFDYSAIGDNVNITSRLEGLTKIYGLSLVVGEDTAKRLPDLPFLEIDLVRVKGRSGPTRLFTLLSVVAAESEWDALKSAHESFLAAYRAGTWREAGALLKRLRERDIAALRGLYAEYEDRLSLSGDADRWDGVYDMERK